ncbi:MAG: hypothetical protein AAF383_22960 [Cyanobacteria bacterium P01_A01_bin.83]
MSNSNSTKQGDRVILQSERNLGYRYFLLFVLASVLIHNLSWFIFQMYKPTQPANKDKATTQPIEFVMIPIEESSKKSYLETQKRSSENFVAEQTTQLQKTTATNTIGDRLSSQTIALPFPPIRILKPQSDRPLPKPKPGSDRPLPSPPIPKLKPKQIPINPLESKIYNLATLIPPLSKANPKLSTANLLLSNYKTSHKR